MLVAVAVCLLETGAVFVVDGRMTVVNGGEGKGARGSYGDTSLAFWSGDDVSCFETMNTFGSWQAKSWESELVGFGSLVRTASCGSNFQSGLVPAFRAGCHVSNANSVQGMGFGDVEL